MTDPAASFEVYRRRLLGLAYRMLGSMAEAEDAVQETYLRWHAVDRATVADPRAFLMTTTTRICLDALRSARARREQYIGPWLPEPVLDTAALAPDTHTELAEDLSIALLLTPAKAANAASSSSASPTPSALMSPRCTTMSGAVRSIHAATTAQLPVNAGVRGVRWVSDTMAILMRVNDTLFVAA
jgi:DNA-directed RNA polymerase specialized sigma24 family protein